MSSASHQKGHSTKQKPDQIMRRPQQSESKHAHKGSHTSQSSDKPKLTIPDAKKEITANHSDGVKPLYRRASMPFEQKSERMENMHKSRQESSQSQQNQQNGIQTAPATANGPNPSRPGSNPVLRGNPHPPRGRQVKRASCFGN